MSFRDNKLYEANFFFEGPLSLIDVGVEVVDPFFPILLKESEVFAVGPFEHLIRDNFPFRCFFFSV